MNAENITFVNGLLSSTGDDGSVSFSVPSCSVKYETVGVGDAEAYGNIEGVGLWIYKDGMLTIKGAGEMPDYASASATPWTGKSITEIVITEGVTKLGSYAFAEAENAKVHIPKSVTKISDSAVASGSTIYGYDNAYAKTFAANNSFTFVNLGATGPMGTDLTWHLDMSTGLLTVTGTGTEIFAQKSDGTKADVDGWTPSKWEGVEYYSYRDNVKTMVIEAPIKTIQGYCLSYFDKCTTIEMPTSYTSLSNCAFHGMSSLNCVYTKGQTPEADTANLSHLTAIGSWSMVGLSFKKIILNDSVTAIGSQTFYDCKKLTDINIPSSLKTIGGQAFYSCSSLTSLELPESITSVSANAFENCTGITALTVKSDSLDMSFAAKLTGLTCIVAPEGSTAETYANANGITFEPYEEVIASGDCGTDLYWKLVDEDGTGVLKIYGSGTTVESGSGGYGKENLSIFYNYRTQINRIEFCDSVTTIASKCFYYLPGLKEVELTSNITTLGDSAFGNCANLSTIYVKGNAPETGTYDLSYVTSMMGGYQFDGAGKTTLKQIKLSSSLTGAIGDKFVSYNSSLEEISFPEGVTSLGDRAIHCCTKLKTLKVYGKNTAIGENFLKVDNDTTSLTTIYGVEGSPAQTYAEANGISFVPIADALTTGKAGENLNWKVTEETDGTYTMTIYGTGTYIQPYITETGTFDTNIAWNEDFTQYDWKDEYTRVNKIVIEAPVTKILGYSFAKFDNVTVLELPTSMTVLQSGSCLNSMDKLKTVYTTGQTPIEGTANLSNISEISDYSLVLCAFNKVIFKENVTIGDYAFVWDKKLETLELPEGVTIGNRAFCGYTSAYKNKLTSVSFPASLEVIPYKCFNMTDDNSAFSANTIITSLTIKNKNATFEGATEEAPYTAFLENFTALSTVYGYSGSTAENFVTWANQYFADNGIDRTLTFTAIDAVVENMPIGDNVMYRLIKNSDGEDTYTMELYGTGTKAYAADSDGNKVNMDWNVVGDRSYNDYASKITKIKISTGTIKDYQGYMFKGLAVTTVELSPDVTFLGFSLFNGIGTIKTVYVTGNEPVEGVADLSNITTLGTYTFVGHQFKEIILSDSLKTIPNYCFGTQDFQVSALEKVVIPASVTSIEDNAFRKADNLVYIEFKGTGFTYTAASFRNITPRATVIAADGSTGEELAGSLGLQFIDSAKLHGIEAYYVKYNSVILLDKVSDTEYTAYCTGSGTYFFMGYDSYDNAVAVTSRPWDDYKAGIKKAVYVNPSFTKIDSSFARHTSLTTVEIPASVTAIASSAFNGASLTTLYIAGNEPVTGVVDLTNITSLGGMSMASCKAHTIKLSDDMTGTWGNNLFFKCENLKYVRIPKGVTGSGGDPFNQQTWSLTTVLVENPDFVFSNAIFSCSTNLKTIIGYSGSTAETFAESKGLTFIPLDGKDILTFDGFQIREEGYNGLRSLFIANLANASTLETSEAELSGLKIVEIGGMMAATDKLPTASTELTLEKDASGKYVSPYDYARVIPVYQNGERVGKVINETDGIAKFACTVRDFSASNYNKNITFRGYVIYADKEGNEYVAYADLTDSEGATHNVASLEMICQELIQSGTVNPDTNISCQDVEKFKNEAVE